MNKKITNVLEQIFAQGKQLTYKKNEVILRLDDEPSGVYFIQQGFVAMSADTADGKQIIFNILKSGTFFPTMWALANIPNKYNFVCLTDTNLLRIPKSTLSKWIKSKPEIMEDLLQRILIGLDGVLTNIEYILSGSAQKRVAAVLLISARRFGQKMTDGKIKILLPMTHQHIADYCGLTRETVSVIISDLSKQKLIKSQKGIIINNLEKLQELTDLE